MNSSVLWVQQHALHAVQEHFQIMLFLHSARPVHLARTLLLPRLMIIRLAPPASMERFQIKLVQAQAQNASCVMLGHIQIMTGHLSVQCVLSGNS